MNKKSRLVNVLVGSFLLLNSVLIFLYAVIGMKFFGHKETEISNSVVLRFDVPTEYILSNPFWWLLDGSNKIKIVNFSNEHHDGRIKINVSDNPCNNIETITLNNTNYVFDNKSENVDLIHIFSIAAYEKKDLEIVVKTKTQCNVKGEDKRNFGIRINSWAIR